jgi:hypothetical protein
MNKWVKGFFSIVVAAVFVVFLVLPPVFAKADRHRAEDLVSHINQLVHKLGLDVHASIKFTHKGMYSSQGELDFTGPKTLNLAPIPFVIYNGPVVMKDGMHFTKGEMQLKPRNNAKSDLHIHYDGHDGYDIRFHLRALPDTTKPFTQVFSKALGIDASMDGAWVDWRVDHIDQTPEAMLKQSRLLLEIRNFNMKSINHSSKLMRSLSHIHSDDIKLLIDMQKKRLSFDMDGFSANGKYHGKSVSLKIKHFAQDNLHLDLSSFIDAMGDQSKLLQQLFYVQSNINNLMSHLYTKETHSTESGVEFVAKWGLSNTINVTGSSDSTYPGLKGNSSHSQVASHEKVKQDLTLNIDAPIFTKSRVKVHNLHVLFNGTPSDTKMKLSFSDVLLQDRENPLVRRSLNLSGGSSNGSISGVNWTDLHVKEKDSIDKVCIDVQQGQTILSHGVSVFNPSHAAIHHCYHFDAHSDVKHIDNKKMFFFLNSNPSQMLQRLKRSPLSLIFSGIASSVNKNTVSHGSFTLTDSNNKRFSGDVRFSFPTGVMSHPRLSGNVTLDKDFFKPLMATYDMVRDFHNPSLSPFNQPAGLYAKKLVSQHCLDLKSGHYHATLGTGPLGGTKTLTVNGKPVSQCIAILTEKKQTVDKNKVA